MRSLPSPDLARPPASALESEPVWPANIQQRQESSTTPTTTPGDTFSDKKDKDDPFALAASVAWFVAGGVSDLTAEMLASSTCQNISNKYTHLLIKYLTSFHLSYMPSLTSNKYLSFLQKQKLSSSGPGPAPRSGPGQVPGQVQGLRTRDLDLGYTLNLVCHPPTHPPTKLFTRDNDSKPLLYDF